MTKPASSILALGAAALCLGLAQANDKCACTATCLAQGDPHIASFFGRTEMLGSASFTLYKVDNFEVTGSTDGSHHNFIQKLNFGPNKSFEASDCTEAGQSLGSAEHSFGKSSKLHVKVQCNKPNEAKYGSALHLDIWLSKKDSGAGSFATMESEMSSSGVCLLGEGTSRRQLRGLSHSGGGAKCSCSARCQAKGDPHLTSFYGTQTLITKSKITLYKDAHLTIGATTFGQYYIGTVTFAGTSLSSSQCKTSKQQLANKTIKVPGGSTHVQVSCMFPSNPDKHGTAPHLDVLIIKEDDSGDGTFQQQERAQGTSGLCTMGA